MVSGVQVLGFETTGYMVSEVLGTGYVVFHYPSHAIADKNHVTSN